ncbi:Uncharacterised protein [Serratia grimesii]|jgi:hypothetical protein|nr:Uncharacterised protein [Serratia grimesii]
MDPSPTINRWGKLNRWLALPFGFVSQNGGNLRVSQCDADNHQPRNDPFLLHF